MERCLCSRKPGTDDITRFPAVCGQITNESRWTLISLSRFVSKEEGREGSEGREGREGKEGKEGKEREGKGRKKTPDTIFPIAFLLLPLGCESELLRENLHMSP